ncbi:four helix bundle protein [Candidatus Nomurabacteria bacterium]|nr:four helix bundle protein [Candidatus Nomurabacteria bacterium]
MNCFIFLGPPPAAPSALLKTKTAYSLWFNIYNDFPKAHRYTLGGKIEDYFLGLLENIFISIYLPPETKIPRLIIAISKLDGVKFFLQIAWENKCISNEKYSQLSEKLDEIGKMLGGWKKGLEKKTP